jgi:hypothetical protein
MLIKIDRLHSAKLIYKNGDLSLQISYLKKSDKTENKQIKNEIKNEAENEAENKQIKYAAIDMGERNLMAVFVDDETTKSLLVDSRPFQDYNKTINEITDYLNELKSKEVLKCETSKTETNHSVKNTEKSRNIDRLINFLHTNKRRLLYEQFNIMSKYVVEYLYLNGVTDLFISKNLANHKFIRIPFKTLLQYIEHNAKEYGIRVHDNIDERYTSKQAV